MKTRLSEKKQLFVCVLLFGIAAGCCYAGSVNTAAALRSLERATSLLGSADWEQASFEARLGETYDPGMADFPYIEALSLVARKAPRADSIERAEYSLSSGLFWRTYSRTEAERLCALLYAETCRYTDALSLLGKKDAVLSADSDYIRVLAYYGLGRNAEARSLVAAALERWPFDSRFPKTFLIREQSLKPETESLKIASVILSRLYVWENDDRELLLLAVPFEHDPATRVRNIRTYRSMGKNDSDRTAAPSSLSVIYALEYGIITEEAAEEELFSTEKTTGIQLSLLSKLCNLAGKKSVRDSITDRLDGYAGIITDDANGDGVTDTYIRYRLGRPVEAVFDRNQDGYPDYSVACDLGEPAVITGCKGNPVINYDTYPSVRTVVDGKREYTMKPKALSWAPVEWVREDLGLKGNAFYTIKLTGKEVPLTERLLASFASFYRESDPDRSGGDRRVVLENGMPVSSESRENGRVYSWTSYVRGYPSLTKEDRDGDGYFETEMLYGPRGVLSSVLVDRNGNRRVEYREDYYADGSMRYRWDTDENGIFEISWTKTANGSERTEWLHPDTGVPVIITVENGKPRQVMYGPKQSQVAKDPVADIWWIGRIPDGSRDIVKKLDEVFNQGKSSVVSYIMPADTGRVYAVRTGGLLFAEFADEE